MDVITSKEFITTIDGTSPLTSFVIFSLIIIIVVVAIVKQSKKTDANEKDKFIDIFKEVITANNTVVREQIKESSNVIAQTISGLTNAIDKFNDNLIKDRHLNASICANMEEIRASIKNHEIEEKEYRKEFRETMTKQNEKIDKLYWVISKESE